MDRAFIAAPLLGTIIFLAAMVFIMHITQVEKAEVAALVADTYHARVNSLLEQYRSDLGVLFAVSLSKSIENWLSSQCWVQYTLSNAPAPSGAGGVGIKGTLGNDAPTAFAPAINESRGDVHNFNYDNLPFCHNNPVARQPSASNPGARCDDGGGSAGTGSAGDALLCKENCNGQLDYHELRYRQCERIAGFVTDGVCPFNPDFGLPSWIQKILDEAGGATPFQVEGVKFYIANKDRAAELASTQGCKLDDPGLNGIVLTDCYGPRQGGAAGECEGKSSGCNTESKGCQVVIGGELKDCSGASGKMVVGSGSEYCRQLIGDSLFDCRNFAVNTADPFRCCDKFYYNAGADGYADLNNGKCCEPGLNNGKGGCDAKTHVVPGCEQGSFFVKVNVSVNDEVFKRLPRVKAEDLAGNQIRSGAIGDRPFYVPVNYPVYKYLDYSLKMYGLMAYGAGAIGGSGSELDDPALKNSAKHRGTVGAASNPGNNQDFKGQAEGVVDGICYGACDGFNADATGEEAPPGRKTFSGQFPPLPLPPTSSIDDQKSQVGAKIFVNLFSQVSASQTTVCRLFDGTHVIPLVRTQNNPKAYTPICTVLPAASPPEIPLVGLNAGAVTAAIANQLIGDMHCTGGHPCVYADSGVHLEVKFKDYTSETLTKPGGNEFCFALSPEFYVS